MKKAIAIHLKLWYNDSCLDSKNRFTLYSLSKKNANRLRPGTNL